MRLLIRRLTVPALGGLAVILAACGGSDTGTPAPAAAPAATPAETAPAEPAAVDPAPAEAAPEAAPETTEAAVPAAGATGYAAYTGDPVKGKRVFAQCMTCHAVQEGRNNVGPSLYQIVGRESGTIPGFKYSAANQNSDVVWTEENLFEYLENPQAYIPGTIMAFPGLRNPQDRADVIAYLKNPT
ncbi:MAG: cytochrome c family protein [Hyphomonas sp.]|uniref:c-type cytochrome n=1 Tax=Hyphomonas sp. TaxID=87 RepID=UPI001DA29461|nr:cytochrome c family protein [Hyphomonas sp.]MBA4225974.1 cytochrome c family protein [Hyphomonas sp.]